ncbi:serine/threonine-protein kinase [Granulicella sibirica]|uniref:Serine/threonine protein kinase n=1 Tax=Granulicella sibirica TaxID=2479048 RepID=A0A4Q0T3I7_9BACT|nr:serine/threonine-protein kinase [Granulicella sibirica]RXH58285.1 serine/threonine protein kinase [Granulicella sibirica]
MNEEPTLPLPTEPSSTASVSAASRKWGGFELLARVGHGGFGEVYRAWDPHLRREVALKLLLPGVVGGDQEYQMMLREARALASVQHPNIVHVYGIDRHDGRVGFWTDFVRGKTLSVLLGDQGPFGYREAALIGLDVTKALSAVHRAGILHRDIKAENVMREEGGRILLMDFGLSALPQRAANLAGTPNYMAPELFVGSPPSAATDVYAIGVLLYFLVSGTHPAKLTGLSLEQMKAALRKRTPLVDVRSDLPEGFLRVVNTAMESDPSRRFSSAGRLAEALAETLGSGATSASSEVIPPKKRARVAVFAGAGVLLLLIAGGAWKFEGSRRSSPASAGTSVSDDDLYQRAEGLLLRSYQEANTVEAVKEFQALLAANPNYALAQAGLGTAYFIQYRGSDDPRLLEMAKAATSRAIQLDPNIAPPYVTLARIAAMEGQNALAMQQAQKAMSIDKRNADAYRALSEVYDAEGRGDDALASMQKAADLAPDDWRWAMNLGGLYLKAGRLDEAAQEYKKSADLAKDNATAYYDLGLVAMRRNKLDEARASLERSLAIEPNAGTYELLGELLVLQGKYGEAVTTGKKAAGLSPNDYRIWGDLGGAYLMTPDGHEKAMEAFRKAVTTAEEARKKEPNNPELLVLLADAYAWLGEKDRSAVLLRQTLTLSSDDPNIDYRAGATYEILGQRDTAMRLIAKALARGAYVADFERDPYLAGLRKDPAFTGILADAKSKNAVDTPKKRA